MDIIEPLWFTISTVNDLLKAGKELSSEMIELRDTVKVSNPLLTLKLISAAIKPVMDGSEGNEIREDLKDVIDSVKKGFRS